MSEPNGQNGEQPADRGQGGIALDPHHVRGDLKLIDFAVRQKWQIREQAFTILPDQMLALALDKEQDPRVRVNAGRVVVTMHGQNEDTYPKTAQPGSGVTVNVGVAVQTEQLVNDPQYLAYVRSRVAGMANADAGDVRGNGEPRSVEVPAAPASDRHGGNGHAGRSNGNGHSHS